MSKIIEIKIMRHKHSDLLVAVSDNLKGLMVHGRSDAELDERIPIAIRDILEAMGKKVLYVKKLDDDVSESDFAPPLKRFKTELTVAN